MFLDGRAAWSVVVSRSISSSESMSRGRVMAGAAGAGAKIWIGIVFMCAVVVLQRGIEDANNSGWKLEIVM